MKKFAALLVLVVAFFAAPAVAECPEVNLADLTWPGSSLGNWPEMSMNFDDVSSGTQQAMGFWNGDAANALTVEKGQQAGTLYQEQAYDFHDGADGTLKKETPRLVQWDTRVINIERVSSGNQFATATGSATAKNSITVCSAQNAGTGCTC